MIRCILLCHDVLRIDEKLSGSSQDELVTMEEIEENYESTLLSRDSNSMQLRIRGQVEEYSIIQVHEFTSDRKMMSVTVQRQ